MEQVVWNQETGEIKAYPRLDDHPIEGLQSPPWKRLRVIREALPVFDQASEFLRQVLVIDSLLETLTYGWQIESKPPDYQKFYDGILTSGAYASVVGSQGKTGDQSTAISVFATSLLETKNQAKTGNENREAFQASIYLLLDHLNVQQEGLAELQALLESCNMAGVYSLNLPS